MNENPLEELTSVAASVFSGQRASRRSTTMLSLQKSPTLFRWDPRADAQPERISLQNLIAFETRAWRPTGQLRSILEECADGLAGSRATKGWNDILLTFLASWAADWVRLLVGQFDDGEHAVSDLKLGDAFRRAYRGCLHQADQCRRLFSSALESLIESIQRPPSGRRRATQAAMVQFVPDGRATQVRWLTADGKELCREPLEALIGRMSSCQVAGLSLRRLGKQQAFQAEYRAAAEETLGELCPGLADAVERARQTRRMIGYCICPKATVYGLPVQVCLYADPGVQQRGEPVVHLAALRANEEFVLQNVHGALFYFPPIQLVARIELRPSPRIWQLRYPEVRMPKGGPMWVHPYTGRLSPDRFARAEMVTPDYPEPMASISKAGQQLLPKHVDRYPEPMCNDMCLTHQSYTIRKLEKAARRAEQAGQEPGAFNLIWGLWNIVSVGLSNGHQKNLDTPRTVLESGEMRYRVTHPSKLARSKLAGRIFPYDPARPVIS